MQERLAVIGTGTEIGKSYVSAALARACRKRGNSVLAIKPVETGVHSAFSYQPKLGLFASLDAEAGSALELPQQTILTPAQLTGFELEGGEASDSQKLAAAAGLGALQAYALRRPISPHLAAELAGVEIQLSVIRAWYDRFEAASEVLVLETAGGALSPIARDLDNLDLVAALAPQKILLVAPNRLGVLHDVAATLAAAQSRSVEVSAVVLTDGSGRPDDASLDSNARELCRVILPRFAAKSCQLHSLARDQDGAELLSHLLPL